MRVALFGGSFNPPHVAHQLVALYVLETAPVDELWFVPALRAPVRQAAGAVRGPDRDVRARGRGAGAARAASATSSARWAAPSRTLRTIRRLRELHPAHEFSLVIGADLLAEVATWFGGAELQATVPFIVVGRAGRRAPRTRRRARSRCRRSAPRRCAPRWRPESPSRGSCRAPFSTTYIDRVSTGQPSAHELHVRSRGQRPRRWRGAGRTDTVGLHHGRGRRRHGAGGAPGARRRCPSSACTAARSSCRTRRARSRASWRRRATSRTSSAESDVVIISVRDERVPEVARAAGEREAAAARTDPAAHVGRQPGAHDPVAGGAVRARGRDVAPAGVVRRSACRDRGAERRRVRHRGRRAGARDGQAHRAARWARGRCSSRPRTWRSITRAR